MLEGVKNINLFEPKKYLLVQCVAGDKSNRYLTMKVNLTKSGFELRTECLEFDSIGKLKKQMGTKLPVYLGIIGKGILCRATSTSDGNTLELLNKMIPNLDINEFGYELVRSKWGGFASVARKETVNHLLKELSEFRVIGVSLGPFSVQSALGVLEQNEIVIDNLKITCDGELAAFEKSDNPSEDQALDGSQVNPSILPVLGKLLSDKVLRETVADNTELGFQKNEEKQKMIFERVGIVAASLLLVVMLSSFIYSNSLKKAHQSLSDELALYQAQPNELVDLQFEIEAKRQLLAEMGFFGGGEIAAICDKLAATVPETISLTDVWINPSVKKIKPNEVVVFNSRQLVVKGTSPGTTEINLWSINLNKEDWVDDVKMLGYERTENAGEFELLIELH